MLQFNTLWVDDAATIYQFTSRHCNRDNTCSYGGYRLYFYSQSLRDAPNRTKNLTKCRLRYKYNTCSYVMNQLLSLGSCNGTLMSAILEFLRSLFTNLESNQILTT